MNGSSVKAYSKAKDGGKKVVSTCPNFLVREFACSDGSDVVFVSPDLVKVLQQIRNHFNAPVTIDSGYRTVTKNKAVGGATYSQHLYGMAADITVKGVSAREVYAYADSLMPHTGGVGQYATFTHVDVRKTKSRWKG